MKVVFLLFILVINVLSAPVFKHPNITTRYSEKLLEKNAQADSLVPKFDGNLALRRLLLRVPELWTLKSLESKYEIVTQLKLKIQYIDGVKEEPFCNVASNISNEQFIPTEWSIDMGLDFVSGGSNVVEDHVRLCLEKAREEFGVAVMNEAGKLEFLVSSVQIKEMNEYRVNAKLDDKIRMKVLQTSKAVAASHQCPTDIHSYRMLMEVYRQTKDTPADLMQINQELSEQGNGGNSVFSCAFSRDWNHRYSQNFEINCDVDEGSCDLWQSDEGRGDWQESLVDAGVLNYQGKSILGVVTGPKSIHEGGVVMDLKLIPLSKQVYLEAYLNKKKEPISLGLLIIDGGDANGAED